VKKVDKFLAVLATTHVVELRLALDKLHYGDSLVAAFNKVPAFAGRVAEKMRAATAGARPSSSRSWSMGPRPPPPRCSRSRSMRESDKGRGRLYGKSFVVPPARTTVGVQHGMLTDAHRRVLADYAAAALPMAAQRAYRLEAGFLEWQRAYPELEALGLITMKPGEVVHTITDEGRAALAESLL
jgi:hypothetical protein